MKVYALFLKNLSILKVLSLMKPPSFFYLFFFLFLFFQSTASDGMSPTPWQCTDDFSSLEDTQKVKRDALWERHKVHAVSMQAQLSDRRSELEKNAKFFSKSLIPYAQIQAQIQHLTEQEALLKEAYEKSGLNYETPDPTLLATKVRQYEALRQDRLQKIKESPSPLYRNELLRLESRIDILGCSPESYRNQIQTLKEQSEKLKKILQAPETYLAEVDKLLGIKVSTNVSLNLHAKDAKKKLPNDRAISVRKVLSLLKNELAISDEIFDTLHSQSIYRYVLGALEGLDPIEEGQQDESLETTLQILKMMIEGFRTKLEKDVLGFMRLISHMSEDFKELSHLQVNLNPEEQEAYAKLFSPIFAENPLKEEIFSEDLSYKAGQEAFLKILTSYDDSLTFITPSQVHVWLPYAIPNTKAAMMHRLIGAFRNKTYHSWEEKEDTSDKILTSPDLGSFLKEGDVLYDKASELFLSSIHDILAHHVNLQFLEHMKFSVSSLFPESEALVEKEEVEKEREREEPSPKRQREEEAIET